MRMHRRVQAWGGTPSIPHARGASRWMACGLAGFLLSSSNLLSETPASSSSPRSPTPLVAPGADDWFVDVTSQSGIQFLHQFPHTRIANILLSNGTGAAVFDYDGDGLVDLYFLNWGPLPGVSSSKYTAKREPNRLYRNLGNGRFEDQTLKAGLSGSGFNYAVCAGDYDNDGHEDLYVTGVGQSFLYHNRGDGTFEEVTSKAGVGNQQTGVSAVFLDIDRDGFLDLFVANYLTFDPSTVSEQNPGAYPGPLAYPGEANVLFRNRGDGTFEDVSVKAGIRVPGHRAMSVSAFDCDWDGDTDLYLSNDDTPNMLWLNDGRGRFLEVAIASGVAFNSIGEACGSMNAATGDCDGDGLPDLFVTRLGYGSLYLRRTNGLYEDRIYASGLGAITQRFVGWGGSLLDMENDGDLDVFIANGDAFTLEGDRSLLVENQGAAKFVDASRKGGAFFQVKIQGRGSAGLDYDDDGKMDLLVTALADRAVLLRNRCPSAGHWLKLDLQGTKSNRDGFGALITVVANGKEYRAEALCPTGFLTQGDRRVHFGLGQATRVESLTIRWPSGRTQRLEGIKVDQVLRVMEPTS
jgi:hypothetical protein